MQTTTSLSNLSIHFLPGHKLSLENKFKGRDLAIGASFEMNDKAQQKEVGTLRARKCSPRDALFVSAAVFTILLPIGAILWAAIGIQHIIQRCATVPVMIEGKTFYVKTKEYQLFLQNITGNDNYAKMSKSELAMVNLAQVIRDSVEKNHAKMSPLVTSSPKYNIFRQTLSHGMSTALSTKRLEEVRQLITMGASPNTLYVDQIPAPPCRAITPLSLAREAQNREMENWLLKNGASE